MTTARNAEKQRSSTVYFSGVKMLKQLTTGRKPSHSLTLGWSTMTQPLEYDWVSFRIFVGGNGNKY
jgi:hypothetical protein